MADKDDTPEPESPWVFVDLFTAYNLDTGEYSPLEKSDD